MAFEPGQRGQFVSQINVTPLVDVMLVLLVIFMVTAPIIQQGVQVALPKVKAEALPGKEEQFVVSITRDNQIYLNDSKLSAADLTVKLAAIARERPDRQVFIRADEQVPYGEVIRTMAAIKAAGIENVDGDQRPRKRHPIPPAKTTVASLRNKGRGSAAGGLHRSDCSFCLGHVVFAFVFFIAPRWLHSEDKAPPAYTVKIVDALPAGD